MTCSNMLAFTKFKNRGWLTTEELRMEKALRQFIEEEKHAHDINCDVEISGMSDEQLKEILQGARRRMRLRLKKNEKQPAEILLQEIECV
jgi:hypothetical protein